MADSEGVDTLGVSVYHLSTAFLDKVIAAGLSREATIYEIDYLRIIPTEVGGRSAYECCLEGEDHVGKATCHLSHTWSYTIGEIIDALQDYCDSFHLDPKRTYVSICIFSLSQDRRAELRNASVDSISTFTELVLRSGHVLAMVTPWDDALSLKRVWCYFEIYVARKNGGDFTIIMPPREKESLIEALNAHGEEAVKSQIYVTLARTMVQAAVATVEEDRRRILEMIESGYEGGLAKLNVLVNEGLRDWMNRAKHRMIRNEFALAQEMGHSFNEVGRSDTIAATTMHPRSPAEEESQVDLDLLGVSVYHLATEFMDLVYANGLGDDAKIYEIEDLNGPPGLIRSKGANVICPKDGMPGAAYVHCLHGADNKGKATFMLSYTWGYPIGVIVDTLLAYCQDKNLNTKRAYVWICCLCVNQHRVVQQEVGQRTGMVGVDFSTEFSKRVIGIRHVLSMMTPWHEPTNLNRVWCIFEIFTAHQEQQCTIEIVLPPREKRIVEYTVLHDKINGMDLIYDALSRTAIQKAKASVENDRIDIMNLVEEGVGHVELNQSINELLRNLINSVILELMQAHTIDSVNSDSVTEQEAFAKDCEKRGGILLRLEEHDSALEEYRKCLAIRESVLGNHHPDTASTYESIGSALSRRGDDEEALVKFRTCLEIRESALGTDHPDTASAYESIGNVLFRRGDNEGALVEYRKCLATRERALALGRKHPDTAKARELVGSVLEEMGDLQAALAEYRETLGIYELLMGEFHTDTALIQCKIGKVLCVQGQRDIRKGLAVLEKVLGKDHPDVVQVQARVDDVLQQDRP